MAAGARLSLAAALAVPLVVYGWVGSYARYTADDYCWAGVLREQGFLRAQAWWYLGYSPRYAFTFIVNAVELAGPGIAPLLPSVAIVSWVATLTWTVRQFGLQIVAALLLALALAVATFQTAPDLGQSLFWQTGMLTYVLPLVLATFLIGWIARATRLGQAGWRAAGVCFGITFVAGGLSETYLIPQNAALTLALAVSLVGVWRGSKSARAAAILLGAALLGGVLALTAIVVAPATPSRVGGSPADLWLAFAAAVATAAYQLGRLVRYFAPVLALCLLLPGLLLGDETPRPVDLRKLALVSALTAIVVPFAYFPSFYASNGNPPARSLIVPGCILIAYAVYVGYALRGVWRVPRRLGLALVLLLALVPLGIGATMLPEQARAAAYAGLWDAEDAHIRTLREAGVTAAIVEPLPPNLGEQFVSDDPDDWFNQCVARYYGLDSIAARGE